MPVHDGDHWLSQTLDSIAGQDVTQGIECVVVDSSQGDGTAALVRDYQDRLHIRLFRRPDLAHWRLKTNFGFEQAQAAHVSMLHQDDFWLPGRAASVRSWLQEDPAAVMHLHAVRIVDENSRSLGRWTCPLPTDAPIDPQLLLHRLLVQNFIAVPTPVIRRDAFLAVGGIDEALWYTGDWDLYLKLARTGPVRSHDDVLAALRIHGRSMTVSGSRDQDVFREQMTCVLDRHIGSVPAPWRDAIRTKAMASIAVNVGLASANNGHAGGLMAAAKAILSLGPAAIPAFLRDSRLKERVAPRLRARLAGRL